MSDLNDKMKSVNRRVSRWARHTGEIFSQWWEDVSALQDRRNEIHRLARERQQLLVDMGAKVYTLHRKGKVQNRDLLVDCERIDGIAEEIKRLELEIAEIKRAQGGGREVEIEDESPVVAPEDADVSATADIPQETDKEGEVPCAHAQTAAEGPVGDEPDEPRVECAPEDAAPSFAAPEPQQETDKEGAEPCAHAHTAAEGPADDEDDESGPECEGPTPPAF